MKPTETSGIPVNWTVAVPGTMPERVEDAPSASGAGVVIGNGPHGRFVGMLFVDKEERCIMKYGPMHRQDLKRLLSELRFAEKMLDEEMGEEERRAESFRTVAELLRSPWWINELRRLSNPLGLSYEPLMAWGFGAHIHARKWAYDGGEMPQGLQDLLANKEQHESSRKNR